MIASLLLMSLQSEPEYNLSVVPLPAASKQSLEDHTPREGIYADPKMHTWGCSVIQEDGKSHMVLARWPRSIAFLAWLTHSVADYAVADKPEGPYRHVKTLLDSGGKGAVDQVTIHNPKIKKFGDAYYLYYISSQADVTYTKLIETARVGYSHPVWKVLRANQRTFVATSDSLTGPYKRPDKVLVEPTGPIETLTVNPAITQGMDGEYVLVVKGDKPNETRFIRNQAVGLSDSPTGPFEVQPKAVIDTFDTEDVSIWFDKTTGVFWGVYHAHTYIGLIYSRDGINWELPKNHELTKNVIPFDDGTTWTPGRMERPFILTNDQGQPTHLYVACFKDGRTWNICLELKRS